MCDLDSDVAGSSNDTQRIQPKPKTQLSSTGRPVCGQESTKGIEKRNEFDHDTLGQDKHGVADSPSTVRPVCGPEYTKRCVLTPEHVEEDQTSTGRPVLVDQQEEHEIDFRVPKLSDAVVKEAEHLRVQELVKNIENHPHRDALHADLQQNNVYNPFSKNSKEMIHELVIWSYLSCAKIYQKYNVLTVFFIGIKELYTARADKSWLKANPVQSLTN